MRVLLLRPLQGRVTGPPAAAPRSRLPCPVFVNGSSDGSSDGSGSMWLAMAAVMAAAMAAVAAATAEVSVAVAVSIATAQTHASIISDSVLNEGVAIA